MTIAMGMLTRHGVIVAADTEETGAMVKIDQTKIVSAITAHRNASIAVSGAGQAYHLDCLNQEVCSMFETGTFGSAADFERALKDKMKEFHQTYQVPAETSWIVGACIGQESRLWASHQMMVWRGSNHVATGMGGDYASAMLKRYWESLEVTEAIPLATYMMSNIKTTVPYCGKRTEMIYLSGGHAVQIPTECILALEDILAAHTKNGNSMLTFIISRDTGDGDARIKQFSDKLQECRKEIGKVMASLTLP